MGPAGPGDSKLVDELLQPVGLRDRYRQSGADHDQAAVDGVKAALPNLPAVRADRVYGLDETDFEAGGVTVISALETVTDRIAGGSPG